jgi:hypothetical protein
MAPSISRLASSRAQVNQLYESIVSDRVLLRVLQRDYVRLRVCAKAVDNRM